MVDEMGVGKVAGATGVMETDTSSFEVSTVGV